MECRKILATYEQGRKYTLEVSGEKETALFNVDGYIITQGLKCDKLVWVNMNQENENKKECDIFVELKGKDVAHAIEQIRETLKNPYFKYSADCKTLTLII